MTTQPISNPEPLALSVQDLRISLGAFELLADKWDLPTGRISALVGANGAGKTTFIGALGGRVPLKNGTIRAYGAPTMALGHRLPEIIGVVPDTFAGMEELLVRHHLEFIGALTPGWDESYAQSLIARLGIPIDQKVGTLSHGTLAKLNFVSHESSRPPVLLLDEPTSGLDPGVRHELLDILRAGVRECPHRAFLLSTHLLEDVAAVADSIALVRRGVVAAPVTDSAIHEWRALAPVDRYPALAVLFGSETFE